MSDKPTAERSQEKLNEIRKRNQINTANFRARHSANLTYIKRRINEILPQLGRPTIDFSKKKSPHVLKGKARPIHLPPEEERKNMTDAQVSEWKTVQRKKRKAEQARIRRAREDVTEKNIKKLWSSLETEIAQKEGREVPLLDLKAKSILPVPNNDGAIVDFGNANAEIKHPGVAPPALPPIDMAADEVKKPAAANNTSQDEEDGALLFLASVASKNHDDSPDQKQAISNNSNQVDHEQILSEQKQRVSEQPITK